MIMHPTWHLSTQKDRDQEPQLACLLTAAPRKAFLFHTLPPQALEMASPIVLCALTKTLHSRVLSCLSNS